MIEAVWRKLKPLYGKQIDVLWLEYQTADQERKHEIEALLAILAAKRLGTAIGDERILLEPPPATIIGQGEFTLGEVLYPGIPPYRFAISRAEMLRHMFLLGPSGTGKSTVIIGLLRQFLPAGIPWMAVDFKRNYRALLTGEYSSNVLVITVGRNVAPLRLNVLLPPTGVGRNEWVEALADIIGTSYLLLQGARNVLKQAMLGVLEQHGDKATLRDALGILKEDLARARSGSRRYGWLESSYRSIEELSKNEVGDAFNSQRPIPLDTLLRQPVVFELQALGEDQRKFFCLYLLQAILLIRKHQLGQREVLQHVLVFDEAHNVFPKDQWGELSIPSRLAREVREYGEALITATQQADISDAIIANSGIKIVMRCDFPRDVELSSKLLQVKPEYLSKIPVGQAIARLATRYYPAFLFGFPPQPVKNIPVSDEQVRERHTQWRTNLDLQFGAMEELSKKNTAHQVSDKEFSLLRDIATNPIAGVTQRYERLGWNAKTGNDAKNSIIDKGLAEFVEVPTKNARMKILTLTTAGEEYLESRGVPIPASRRGGSVHEYWRLTIQRLLEKLGFTVQIEFPVGNGQAVDLRAERGNHVVFVEIETGKSDINANIQKCKGLPGRIVFFFVSEELLARWEPAVSKLSNGLVFSPATLSQMANLLG